MNKEHTAFQLREALEELERMVKELPTDPEYDDVEFEIAISHVYHHLNTAWNARNEPEERTTACSKADFNRWRQFPKEIDLDAGSE